MRSILVLTTALALAAPAAAEPRGSGWSLTRWWPFGKTPAKQTDSPPAKTEKASANAEGPAVLRARAKADYLRRVAVCDRLQAIAVDANDQDLARKAEQLELRAWEVYRQRTACLPAGDPSLDHQGLDRHAGADARLPTRPLDSSASRGSGQHRTSLGEVKR